MEAVVGVEEEGNGCVDEGIAEVAAVGVSSSP